MSDPIEIWGNGWVRAYDNLDRRMDCTPQEEWTPEMVARAVSDQRASGAIKKGLSD